MPCNWTRWHPLSTAAQNKAINAARCVVQMLIEPALACRLSNVTIAYRSLLKNQSYKVLIAIVQQLSVSSLCLSALYSWESGSTFSWRSKKQHWALHPHCTVVWRVAGLPVRDSTVPWTLFAPSEWTIIFWQHLTDYLYLPFRLDMRFLSTLKLCFYYISEPSSLIRLTTASVGVCH